MDGHFRAFSFVDRITSVRPGVQVRGIYQIPAGIAEFPQALAAEAVGQLAAWSAMAKLDFKFRPVAGIAETVELHSTVRPGQAIELAADIEEVDVDAVAYSGVAHFGGIPVVRLNHCVGPMLPQEDFDDPAALKNRFELLCETGATPGGFGGIPPLVFKKVGSETGKWIRADLPIPATADLFADHFARRPVFPGTLFMHNVLELATDVVAGIPVDGGKWVARKISDGKLRTFIPPGDLLEFEARLAKHDNTAATVFIEARKGKRVTGSSRITFAAEKKS